MAPRYGGDPARDRKAAVKWRSGEDPARVVHAASPPVTTPKVTMYIAVNTRNLGRDTLLLS
jgi:hypothetical protein